MKLADKAGLVLSRLAEADRRFVVLDGDLADSDGAEHFAKQHPDRFLMAGIAEQGMVSVAAGMATTGLRPWVFSFAAFLCYRAYDQVRVCLSQTNLPVVLVGSHAGGLAGRNGKTHAAHNDLALMLSLPNMHVWAPADFPDVETAIVESAKQVGPSYIRMPRRQFRESENLPGEAALLRWIRPRQKLTIVSTGLGTHWAVAVADRLTMSGVEVGLLHCLRLKPVCALAEQLQGVDQLVTIEDHYCFGGLASVVAQHCPTTPLTCFGWPSDFTGKSGADDDLRKQCGLADLNITSQILRERQRRNG